MFLKDQGIPLCNTPDYGIEEIAATAASHLLNLWRRISAYDQACRHYESGWAQNLIRPIPRISKSTLGVVGTGRIGTQIDSTHESLRLPNIWDLTCISQQPGPGDIGYTRVESLDELLAESDAISLHCVLTEETAGMVDEKFIATMKPGALLVNTARGGLFRGLDVLEQALRSGQLGGLGTDVLPNEPPSDHPLIEAWRNAEPWLNGRLVITPHTAYYSDSALYDMRYKAAETAALFLDRGELRNRVI